MKMTTAACQTKAIRFTIAEPPSGARRDTNDPPTLPVWISQVSGILYSPEYVCKFDFLRKESECENRFHLSQDAISYLKDPRKKRIVRKIGGRPVISMENRVPGRGKSIWECRKDVKYWNATDRREPQIGRPLQALSEPAG
jgi:hypothetical protein